MLKQLRENVWIGDKDAYKSIAKLKEIGIKSVIVVADDFFIRDTEPNNWLSPEVRLFKMGLRADHNNPQYIKDLICHTALQMINNGETILIQSVTGLERASFVACRVVCELEGRTIYEIMQEIKTEIPEFDFGKAYY